MKNRGKKQAERLKARQETALRGPSYVQPGSQNPHKGSGGFRKSAKKVR